MVEGFFLTMHIRALVIMIKSVYFLNAVFTNIMDVNNNLEPD